MAEQSERHERACARAIEITQMTIMVGALVLVACNGTAPRSGLGEPLGASWLTPTMPVLGPTATGDFYRYAPSVVQLSAELRAAYACGNTESTIVRDHILYREAARSSSGNWSWSSSESVALSPSSSGFDSVHVCDPEFLQGTPVCDRLHGCHGPFSYGGNYYSLALFYTGTNDATSDGGRHNAIGVALSNSPRGPWVRVARPIIPYPRSDGDFITGICPAGTSSQGGWAWGVGQPSATEVSQGRVLVFYTHGDCNGRTTLMRADVDLSNLDRLPDLANVIPVTSDGLTLLDGEPDGTLNNASFIYEQSGDRFLMVRDGHHPGVDAGGGTFVMEPSCPTNVGDYVQLAAIDAASIWGGGGTWQVLGNIATTAVGQNPWPSGWARNHDAGLLRTPYGDLADTSQLPIFFTASPTEAAAGGTNDWPNCTGARNLYRYRIANATAALH